jgi:tRNA threonylcarbamoyladenosine biosynthesis protein TsaB
MLLLAADTSGKHGSIALARGNADGSCEVLEVVPLTGGNFSAQLIPQVAALLSKHGFHKKDLDGFAAVSGPGSFTGLRVGLAAIKALGEATGKPIATVSLLELVALAGDGSGRVLAALDAGRGEVYLGHYEIAGDRASMVSEKLITRAAVSEAAPGGTVVTPDTSVAEALKALGVKTVTIEPPASDAVARLGWKKILARDTVPPEALEANYIRRTDAEIFSKSGT